MSEQNQEIEKFIREYFSNEGCISWHSTSFPYVVLRVNSGVYQVFIFKEQDKTMEKISAVVDYLMKKYRKEVCAVYTPDECVYYRPNGGLTFSDEIPYGGIILKSKIN